MPKAKKMGRPKLPKGHAKGVIRPVRFTEAELKRFSSQAKSHNQTLSEWLRERLIMWDDRLDERGIDAIVWQGANQGDDHRKKLTFIFKELKNDRRVTIDLDLIT